MSLSKYIPSFLKTNKIYFNLIKNRYYKRLSHTKDVAPEYRDVFNALVKDGVVIIPNFISNDIIDSILSETKDPLSAVMSNEYDKTKHHYFPNYGTYQVLECDKISPSSKIFFDNNLINELACSYVSKDVNSFQKMIELRPDPGKESVSDIFHFDDWRHRYKAFLYLTDVSNENAPFVYLKGSHAPHKWREKKEYEYFRYGKSGSYGSFFIQEVDYLKSKYNFEPITCTGKKGTLILTDARGLHKGTPLVEGKRVLLANFFDQR